VGEGGEILRSEGSVMRCKIPGLKEKRGWRDKLAATQLIVLARSAIFEFGAFLKMLKLIRTLSFFLSAVLGSGAAITALANVKEKSSEAPPVIVIGFMGGLVRHDNLVHSGVQLAARLRAAYSSGVHVQVFENRHGKEAHEEIVRLLDARQDGQLTPEEKRNARIIIYGTSWGASETVSLARELEKDGIPVLLTIQVDSVAKIGEDDAVIPGNVAEAVNFYQPSGVLHGRREIRAADAVHTRILGNFRSDYAASPVTCEGYPWYARLLWKQHIEIECDRKVWGQVESLIRAKLPAVARRG
jgi:hypothetical protein